MERYATPAAMALFFLATALGCDPSPSGGASTAGAPTGAAKPAKLRVFVANYRDDTVSVVEGDVEREVKVIAAGESPHGLAVRRGTNPLLAVANSTQSQVTLIDPRTLETVGTIAAGTGPQHALFSKGGNLLFVTSPRDGTVSVLDVEKRRPAHEPIALGKNVRRLALSPDGEVLYVLLAGERGEVAVIDANTGKVRRRIGVGRGPTNLALSGDGGMLVVNSFDDSKVVVVDTESLDLVATHDLETGDGLAVHPTKPLVYSMASFDDEIRILDLKTGEQQEPLSFGEWPAYGAFAPDGRHLYIPHEESDSVVKIDTETNQAVAKIAVGREPIEIAFFPLD